MMVKIKLKIADIIIQIESNFRLIEFTEREKKVQFMVRFNNFFYHGKQKPHITVRVEIVDALPWVQKAKSLFSAYHYIDGAENWHLLKKDDTYIYSSPLEDKEQFILANKTFDIITAYLRPKNNIEYLEVETREFIRRYKGFVWQIDDIIYDFLQIVMITYLAQRSLGIFIHSVGIKDFDGKGSIFAGKSGCGKSTTARLWHKHSKALVLNDDRIIVRKLKDKFLIYGSPWHGEFSDYLASRIESAPLKEIFFIHHASKNRAKCIPVKRRIDFLYPAVFPVFWDKDYLINILSFCQDLALKIPFLSLGFVKDKTIIDFVRRVKGNE